MNRDSFAQREASCISLQRDIESRGLLSRNSLLNLPTGSGKTWLAGRAISLAISNGMRAAYLCPLRSIARELAANWSALGVAAFTGEMGVDDGSAVTSPRDVAAGIYTAEKFDAYLRAWQSNLDWLAMIDVLVVDELHLLGEGRRGAILEGVITRFRSINPSAAVICLSATLGNVPQLAAWLDAEVVSSSQRMVPLDWRIAPFAANATAQTSKAMIVHAEIERTRSEGGQSIVFTQSRPRTETLAQYLTERGLRVEAHHAGLSRSRRNDAEARFRSGELDAIVATPTLAMGVNLPARTVVLVDLQRYEGTWTDLSCNEVHQLAGRAGRRGLDDHGEVVLLAPKHNQRAARGYIAGRFEPIHSCWTRGACLHEQILALIGTGITRNAAQTERLIGRSLFASQNRDWTERVRAGVADMLAAGMLREEEGGRLAATRLGRVAVRHQITPRTVLAWQRFACQGERATFLDALILVAASTEREGGLRAQLQDLDGLAQALSNEPLAARSEPLAHWTALFGQPSGRELVSGIKTALALRAWTRLGDLGEAAATFEVDEHALDEARMSAVRLLGALRALLAAMREEGEEAQRSEPPDLAERLRALAAMVTTGLDERHATLALIEGIGPKLARKLLAAGVEDIEDLALAEALELFAIDGISQARAARWIEAAGELLAEGGAYRYREVAKLGVTIEAGTQVLDFYRWRRAADLAIAPGEGAWLVTGGAEPHRVALDGTHCDCPDAAKGHLCKHRIAVMRHLGDAAVPNFDGPFLDGATNLAELWNVSGAAGGGR